LTKNIARVMFKNPNSHPYYNSLNSFTNLIKPRKGAILGRLHLGNLGFLDMAFKINISHKGKTFKVETENEFLVGKKIGETVDGGMIDDNLKGFELEITGISDLSGIPGFKGLEGSQYHRRLLTYGPGMKDRRKGIRLRKTNRGEEISLKIHQVNMKVLKEGDKKFEELVKKEEPAEEIKEGAPVEEAKEKENSTEGDKEKKEEIKAEEKPEDEKEEVKRE
jgi:small subunit ribosomal protein S6e